MLKGESAVLLNDHQILGAIVAVHLPVDLVLEASRLVLVNCLAEFAEDLSRLDPVESARESRSGVS